MTQAEYFGTETASLSYPEILKYMARLRDELGKWIELPENKGRRVDEWLEEGIHDAGERLRFAGVWFAREAIMSIALSNKKILRLEVSPGPAFGDVHWELPHECEAVCPH